MKNKLLSKTLVVSGLKATALLLVGLCAASCADVYDGKESFESTVKNSQVQSPNAADITINVSADVSSQTIKWPVVLGAEGYKVSVNQLTDSVPLVIVKDSIVDGCSMTTVCQEGVDYELSILALGNKAYGNTDAETATVKTYTTFLPGYQTIPSGSELTKWFEDNPIPETYKGKHIVYELEQDGNYTLDGALDFGLQQVTLRTEDPAGENEVAAKAKLKYGEKAAIITQAGLSLKNLVIDASAQNQTNSSIIELSKNPSKTLCVLGKDYHSILAPISIQHCMIEGVNGYIFCTQGGKYCVHNFMIKNTVFHLTTSLNTLASNALINAYDNGAGILHFKMENSTVWTSGNSVDARYLLRYNNSFRETNVYDADTLSEKGLDLDMSAEVAFISCTMYNSFNYDSNGDKGHICNYDGIGGNNRSSISFEMTKCIFVDCGTGQIPRRFVKSLQADVKYTWLYNTYWYKGVSEVKEDGTGAPDYDKSGTILATDPAFVDPANGNFTPTGADQVAHRTGDPRWFN